MASPDWEWLFISPNSAAAEKTGFREVLQGQERRRQEERGGERK